MTFLLGLIFDFECPISSAITTMTSKIYILSFLLYFFRDKENLAVITDHGVIEKLAKLADTEDDTLRAKLAEAIANCCEWPGNRALFGQSGAVAPLVSYLASNDLEVHRTTSVALFQLSKDPWNCVTMHQHGVVGHLLRLIGKFSFGQCTQLT